MPLSAATPREPIHTRNIECRGYLRADGLWDVEGHLTDVKTYSFRNEWRGEVRPGVPVHEMWIRLTIDDALTIHAIEAVTDASPYRVCPEITPNYQRLVGASLRPGFAQKVREFLGGVEGCTHLVELLGPIATTAYQTIIPYQGRHNQAADADSPGKRPRLIDTCHAYASDGEVVKRQWPEFYTGT